VGKVRGGEATISFSRAGFGFQSTFNAESVSESYENNQFFSSILWWLTTSECYLLPLAQTQFLRAAEDRRRRLSPLAETCVLFSSFRRSGSDLYMYQYDLSI